MLFRSEGSPLLDSQGRLIAVLAGGAVDFVLNVKEDCFISQVCPGGPSCNEAAELYIPICQLMNRTAEVSLVLKLDCFSENGNDKSGSNFLSSSMLMVFSAVIAVALF